MSQRRKKATAFLVSCQGKVVLYRRVSENYPALWDCGGGLRHKNESLEDSLKRLLWDFYQLCTEDYEFQVSMAPTHFEDAENNHWEITLCVVRISDQAKPQVGKPDEMGEILEWFSLDEIPTEKLHPGFKADLLKFQEFLQPLLDAMHH